MITPGIIWALPIDSNKYPYNQYNQHNLPIVIISVDKLESTELLDSNMAAIKELISTSACGLMNIRSSAGYTDSRSGYLTIGAGSRGSATVMPDGTSKVQQPLTRRKTDPNLRWNFDTVIKEKKLAVPEIGWILNQAQTEDHSVNPGRLGAIFQRNGWRTCLIGNLDNPVLKSRPGSLILMDRQGLIDEGQVNNSMNENDSSFPYLYRTSVPKVMAELGSKLAAKKLILVEFGDFARLDSYLPEIIPDRFSKLKKATWIHFNKFLAAVLELQKEEPFTLILLSPSVSEEGAARRNLLAPIIIRDRAFPAGVLSSGTTKWTGLVANIDLLPTLANIADIDTSAPFIGKIIKVNPVSDHIGILKKLNDRLIVMNTGQRSLLDWYIGIIAVFWVCGLLCIYLKRRFIGDWLITSVAVIPFIFISLPLLPTFFWQVTWFLLLTSALSSIMFRIKQIHYRMLILSALTWAMLIMDQLLGWHLIRFSALGYNAMAGSRYYGLGNELLGVFLAVSLILAHLINVNASQKWPSPLILSISVFILSWPQLGAKFGGIIAGTIGFTFYLIKLYQWKLLNRKLWFFLFGGGLVLVSIGWWDSLRSPDLQTHIGRFIHLLFSKDFNQVGQIITRKIGMNLKLTVFSPWMRIILLTFALGILNRIIAKRNLVPPEDTLVWQSVLICGIAAYLFNDAGVLAFATCLAYGFSYILLKNTKQQAIGNKRIT